MYFELFLIPLVVIVVLFIIFFIVDEGSHWQKHRVLGVFARYIQRSQGVAFATFLLLTILSIPATFAVLVGLWMDLIAANAIPNSQVAIVDTLLVVLVLLSLMLPVTWSHFRQWRQAVRSMAEVRVRTA